MDGSYNGSMIRGQALISELQAQRNAAMDRSADLAAQVRVLEAEIVRLQNRVAETKLSPEPRED